MKVQLAPAGPTWNEPKESQPHPIVRTHPGAKRLLCRSIDGVATGRGCLLLIRAARSPRVLLETAVKFARTRDVRVVAARFDRTGSPRDAWLRLLQALNASRAEQIVTTAASRASRAHDVSTMLRAAARDAALIVVLERLDLADRDSLLTLETIAPVLPACALLIVATYPAREPLPVTLAETEAELLREPACRLVVLGPSAGDTRAASARATTRGTARASAKNVLRHDGDYWTVGFAGRVVRLRDSKGLRYLAVLMSHPGEPIHATDVHRLALGRTRRAESARGDSRADERARITVTKGIKAALTRIADAHPALGAHLNTAVRRGYFCVYAPDPHSSVRWNR